TTRGRLPTGWWSLKPSMKRGPRTPSACCSARDPATNSSTGTSTRFESLGGGSAPGVGHFRRLGQLVDGVGPALQPGPLLPPSERKQVEEAWCVSCIGRLLEASRHVTLAK